MEYEGQIVGQVRLLFNDSYPGIRSAEIVYLLGEEFGGQGLMNHIILDYTYQSFLRHEIQFTDAWIHPNNRGSIKSVGRAGCRRDVFRHEHEFAETVGRHGLHRYKRYRSQVLEA